MLTIERKGMWIQTFSGVEFYPLDPRPEEINIEDIAHALSNQCRFTGHTKEFYSVAQHSFLVANSVHPNDALWGLLHDAPEAYLVDLARPIKHDPGMGAYRQAEENLMRVICDRFNLAPHQPASIYEADKRMLLTEKRDLLMHPEMDWNTPFQWLHEPYDQLIKPLSPRKAKEAFLTMYKVLTNR